MCNESSNESTLRCSASLDLFWAELERVTCIKKAHVPVNLQEKQLLQKYKFVQEQLAQRVRGLG